MAAPATTPIRRRRLLRNCFSHSSLCKNADNCTPTPTHGPQEAYNDELRGLERDGALVISNLLNGISHLRELSPMIGAQHHLPILTHGHKATVAARATVVRDRA